MALTINSTFAGAQALPYVSASLFQGATLANDWAKVYTDIKYKGIISKMDFDNLVQPYAAAFTAQGTLSKGECVLTPTDLMVNFTYDKKQLEHDWEAAKMTAGAGKSAPPSDFVTYVLNLMAKQTSQEIEFNLWRGNFTGNSTSLSAYTQFTGFLRTLDTCTGTTRVTKLGTFSAGSIFNEFTNAWNSVPGALYDSPDLGFYVSPVTAQLYKQGLANKSLEAAFVKDYELTFLGKQIRTCPGVPDNQILIGEPKNFAFGTDLISDFNQVRIVDLSDTTASLTLRYRADFKAGVCVPYCPEVVWSR